MDQEGILKPLRYLTGRKWSRTLEPIKPLTWKEIAEIITESESEKGTSITAQGCCDLHKRMMRRLRLELEADPLIQEWLKKNPTKVMNCD